MYILEVLSNKEDQDQVTGRGEDTSTLFVRPVKLVDR